MNSPNYTYTRDYMYALLSSLRELNRDSSEIRRDLIAMYRMGGQL